MTETKVGGEEGRRLARAPLWLAGAYTLIRTAAAAQATNIAPITSEPVMP